MDKTIDEAAEFWGDVGKTFGIAVWIALPLIITLVSGFTISLLPFIIVGVFLIPLVFHVIFALSAICILHTKEERKTKIKSAKDKIENDKRAKLSEADSFIKLCRGRK